MISYEFPKPAWFRIESSVCELQFGCSKFNALTLSLIFVEIMHESCDEENIRSWIYINPRSALSARVCGVDFHINPA